MLQAAFSKKDFSVLNFNAKDVFIVFNYRNRIP
jgi:hypothetical protein